MLTQLEKMRNYFVTGATQSYAFRKEQLLTLKKAILQHEQALHEALYKDLKKSPEECWVTETGFLLSEINATLAKLHSWMKPKKVPTNLVNLPSSSYIMSEPLGLTLIISPWNYPLQLLFTPMVGAIAAGNCIVLKASEFAPATDAVMQQIITTIFPPEYILYVQGDGATVIPQLMQQFTFNHVFYTGSTAVGKIIYKMAAERMVPVTLELGGKSPCVVEADADIQVSARRIAMTKFSNAGQMCVAPDYVLVHQSKKEALIAALKHSINSFFSDTPQESYNYGKIINEKQFNRIIGYLQQGTIVHGGSYNLKTLFIEPTLMENVSVTDPIMKEEIFGPVLPILTFNTAAEAKAIIALNPNPLAFYIFTSSKAKENEWLTGVAFGGGCVNNASWHLTNHHLPFGGRGFSGTGQYHGKFSFDTFSHKKAILKTPTWFDPSVKYPPFKGKLGLFKWVIR
ncbi:aldehyde dehydrogenase [Limnovirga soli]|uniref:Aldehyde dehydrogenase n=1 Tax=Limnovirga soli TaxID=2656915 RepID=A0A8J8FJG0_9BACT|nr:aldehyde dehydrogenase [Limnovirga soli]NNV56971.1 aldehyde dehydrogenase family protein [Limnovirga soli]